MSLDRTNSHTTQQGRSVLAGTHPEKNGHQYGGAIQRGAMLWAVCAGLATILAAVAAAAAEDLVDVLLDTSTLLAAPEVPRLGAEPPTALAAQKRMPELGTPPRQTPAVARSTTGVRSEKRPATPPLSATPPAIAPQIIRPELDAPRCEDVYVYVVSLFSDPADNMATMARGRNARGRTKRIGAHVGDWRVIAIGSNRKLFSSAVWLERDGSVCQALLRDDNPVRERRVQRTRAKRARQYKAQQKRAERRRAKAAKRTTKARSKHRKAARKQRKSTRNKRRR